MSTSIQCRKKCIFAAPLATVYFSKKHKNVSAEKNLPIQIVSPRYATVVLLVIIRVHSRHRFPIVAYAWRQHNAYPWRRNPVSMVPLHRMGKSGHWWRFTRRGVGDARIAERMAGCADHQCCSTLLRCLVPCGILRNSSRSKMSALTIR